MSIFGMMGTAISGLSAQANRLGTISDNISNSNTTGYKDASEAFETLLGDQTPGTYSSGGVNSLTNYGISNQGTMNQSSTPTNMAVSGNGFFVVNSSPDGTGTEALTRAGDFTPDANGDLVNSAGYYLMGYDQTGANPNNLSVVSTADSTLSYQPSSTAAYSANLNSTSPIVTGDTAGSNAADAAYTQKTSIVAYDDLGTPVTLNVYTTKTGSDTWEVSVYNAADASATGGFPYTASASASEPINSTTINFDPTTGSLASGSPTSLSVAMPGGAGTQTVSLDLSGLTQLGASYTQYKATADGYAPSKLTSVSIGTDGTLNYNYASGVSVTKYKIPLATVPSPDNLTSLSGNVYQQSTGSGAMTIGAANSSGFGTINSGELEASTVDIATELSNMIQAQQSYEANSKVLQTASDLLSVINNLK